jgi:type VI secretion system secreted protein Hcp
MSRRSVLPVLLPVLLLALLALAGPAQAAEQYFIKIAGIPGESTFQGAEDTIPVDSFTWSMTAQSDRNAFRRGARPTFSDFKFQHQVDKASPLLFRAAARGDRIPSARLTIFEINEERTKRVEYCLEDVLVTGLDQNGKAADGMPVETVALNMGRFEERVIAFNPSTGQPLPPVFFGWDLIRTVSIGFNDSCGSTPTPSP